jgi:hypothetical protein
MNLRALAVAAVAAGLGVAFPTLASAPPGWVIAGTAPADYEFAVDTTTAATGKASASITAKRGARNDGFGTLMQTVAADDYRGARWRLSGYLRTDATSRAQMWMRVDGSGGKVLAFDNMDSRPVTGTTGWTQYDIVLDVPSESVDIAFGFFLISSGKVWGDDFRLEKVDATVPVTAAGPMLSRVPANPDFEDTVLSQTAVWVPRKFRFAVVPGCGTSPASAFDPCDGLRNDIASILQQLGARDVVVTNYEATFSALEPVEGAKEAPANLQRAQARWDKVTFNNSALVMHLMNTSILPLFATRNLSQVVAKLGQRMTVEVLRPVSAAAPRAAFPMLTSGKLRLRES